MAGHSPVAPSSTSGDGGSHGGLTTNKNLAVKRGTEIRQKNHGMGKRFQTIALSAIFLVALLTFGYTYRGWIPGTYDTTTQSQVVVSTTTCVNEVPNTTVISSSEWSKPFTVKDPRCGKLTWYRDDGVDGALLMMANGDSKTIRQYKRGELPNYKFPVTSIQFKLAAGTPVYVAVGNVTALDQLRATQQ